MVEFVSCNLGDIFGTIEIPNIAYIEILTNSMHFEQMSFLGQNAMSHVAPLT